MFVPDRGFVTVAIVAHFDTEVLVGPLNCHINP